MILERRKLMKQDCTKKMISTMLCLILIFLLAGCENENQSYEEGYSNGYEMGFNDGNKKSIAVFSGSFTATVENLLPDYYALTGNTIAVVHFYQDKPFLLHFQEDMTGKLNEGTTYVFEFKTFEVEIPKDEENTDISNYMYSIEVTSYREAEDSETGLQSKSPTVEIKSK